MSEKKKQPVSWEITPRMGPHYCLNGHELLKAEEEEDSNLCIATPTPDKIRQDGRAVSYLLYGVVQKIHYLEDQKAADFFFELAIVQYGLLEILGQAEGTRLAKQ